MANPSDIVTSGSSIRSVVAGSAIKDEMGKAQNDPCMNLWIHDEGARKYGQPLRYRRILEESLDEIFATEYKWMKIVSRRNSSVSLEDYTVGSMIFIWATERKE